MKSLAQRFQKRKFALLVMLAVVISITSVRGYQLYKQVHTGPNVATQIDFVDIDSNNIQDVLTNTDGPFVIEFYSGGSVDAQAQDLIILKVAPSYANKVTFMRMDVNAEPTLAAQLSVQAPSLVMLQIVNGKPQRLNSATGMVTQQAYAQFIDDGLRAAAKQ